jgi:hypothetical protein
MRIDNECFFSDLLREDKVRASMSDLIADAVRLPRIVKRRKRSA